MVEGGALGQRHGRWWGLADTPSWELLTWTQTARLPAMAENVAATTPVKKERPWWVKQRTFVIPSTLHVHIANLPEEIQVIFCFIVSKVVIETKKYPLRFKGVSSKYFKDFIGSRYRDYLKVLDRDWQIIEINDQYLNDPDDGFCKSYRLRPKALTAPKVKVCFRKKQVHSLRDKSELADDVAEFVYHNLKRLTVRTDLLPQADVIDEVAAENWAKAIHFEKFNVHYSHHAKRLYHAAILMPKVARKNLILKADPTLPLCEYDVKSCTPVILLGLADDPAERATLTALVDGDIYTTIANESGVVKDRDEIKRDFMQFVNGSVENYVHTFFHTHLPRLAERVMRARGAKEGMAWFGQRVESEIMAQEVPRQLRNSGTLNNNVQNQPNSLTCGGNPEEILYIPMHDGWLGIERHEDQIAATVRGEFFRRLGYWVTVTKTKLATGEKTRLVGGAPQPERQRGNLNGATL